MPASVDSVVRRIREAVINYAAVKEIQLGLLESEVFRLELENHYSENPWGETAEKWANSCCGIGTFLFQGVPVVQVEKESWLALVLK